MSPNRACAVVVGVFALFCVYFSGSFPPFSSPNELSRFQTVVSFVESGTFAIDEAIARSATTRTRRRRAGGSTRTRRRGSPSPRSPCIGRSGSSRRARRRRPRASSCSCGSSPSPSSAPSRSPVRGGAAAPGVGSRRAARHLRVALRHALPLLRALLLLARLDGVAPLPRVGPAVAGAGRRAVPGRANPRGLPRRLGGDLGVHGRARRTRARRPRRAAGARRSRRDAPRALRGRRGGAARAAAALQAGLLRIALHALLGARSLSGLRGARAPGDLRVRAPSAKVAVAYLLDPARGILLFSPFLLWAVPGFARWWRTGDDRADGGVAIAATLASFLLLTGYPNWHGGWSLGSRYLLPVVFFVAAALPRAREPPLARTLPGRRGLLGRRALPRDADVAALAARPRVAGGHGPPWFLARVDRPEPRRTPASSSGASARPARAAAGSRRSRLSRAAGPSGRPLRSPCCSGRAPRRAPPSPAAEPTSGASARRDLGVYSGRDPRREELRGRGRGGDAGRARAGRARVEDRRTAASDSGSGSTISKTFHRGTNRPPRRIALRDGNRRRKEGIGGTSSRESALSAEVVETRLHGREVGGGGFETLRRVAREGEAGRDTTRSRSSAGRDPSRRSSARDAAARSRAPPPPTRPGKSGSSRGTRSRSCWPRRAARRCRAACGRGTTAQSPRRRRERLRKGRRIEQARVVGVDRSRERLAHPLERLEEVGAGDVHGRELLAQVPTPSAARGRARRPPRRAPGEGRSAGHRAGERAPEPGRLEQRQRDRGTA